MATAREVDLATRTWHNRRPVKDILFLEYVTPTSEIRRLCVQEPYVQAILQVMRDRLHVAWITIGENASLTKQGAKSIRPNPRAAYDMAGIVLEVWPGTT